MLSHPVGHVRDVNETALPDDHAEARNQPDHMRGNRDPQFAASREHVFFSREATAGGRSIGGGGCGCY
ncbi:MAG: DUF4266 domain-containing protein [Planctomycetes bacterium]|nr:DUF4266 domain-containing protein [Planctomycetota bacterium]